MNNKFFVLSLILIGLVAILGSLLFPLLCVPFLVYKSNEKERCNREILKAAKELGLKIGVVEIE